LKWGAVRDTNSIGKVNKSENGNNATLAQPHRQKLSKWHETMSTAWFLSMMPFLLAPGGSKQDSSPASGAAAESCRKPNAKHF